jgi:hypothetical protein
MSSDEHAVLAARAAASPLFVLPLRKAQKVRAGRWKTHDCYSVKVVQFRQLDWTWQHLVFLAAARCQ